MTATDGARPTGIFPAHMIRELFASGAAESARPLDGDQIQPASLDLRLGDVAYRVRASFLTGPELTVEEKLQDLRLHTIPLTEGAVLETGCVYIVPLMERLALPGDIAAAANPKSSTGRLDVFTRVIADRGRAFDTVPAGYSGPLYAEISPRTFPVLVRAGSRLSQIRFRRGSARITEDDLAALHRAMPLIDGGQPRLFRRRSGLHRP